MQARQQNSRLKIFFSGLFDFDEWQIFLTTAPLKGISA
jgi:hypothetical protein